MIFRGIGVEIMLFSELDKKAQEFLKSLPVTTEEEEGISIFKVSGFEGVIDSSFISDFKLADKANKDFEKGAKEHLLLRGGVVIIVLCSKGFLVVSDDRHKVYKPAVAGRVNFTEGQNFMAAALRELLEELFITNTQQVPRDVLYRYVPRIFFENDLDLNNSLGLKCNGTVDVGWFGRIGEEINLVNSALEGVFFWDITDLPVENIIITHEEDWWAGGKFGVNYHVMDIDGKIVGEFAGQQGFIGELGIHTTLEKFLRVEKLKSLIQKGDFKLPDPNKIIGI